MIDGVDAVFPKIGPDGVWVAGDGRSARLDTTRGDLLEAIEAPGAAGHLATTQGLWIAHPDGIWSVESGSGVLDEIGGAVSALPPGEFGAPFTPVAEPPEDVIHDEPLQFSSEYGMDVTPDGVWVPVVRQPRIVRVPIDT